MQLILPETLKLLPLYSLALHKCPLLRPDVRPDERSTWLTTLMAASCPRLLGMLHPRLFALHALLVGVANICGILDASAAFVCRTAVPALQG